jgi:beta-galactosidase/beta-glucuronidase
MNRIAGLLVAALWLSAPAAHAQVDEVRTYKDGKGWKLLVNGKDYYIKGVVWRYTPIGRNYSYDLFDQPDALIRKVLDYEFGLMQAAGINTIRTFTMIPPEWVEYIYCEFGIMSVINPLMGRYGYNVAGTWVPYTDYSDPPTRDTLKRDMADVVRRYKDTPGVLMFAFGNESNYGLSWSSFEIENLPVGEQDEAKARSLYSLFDEVITEARSVAPDHLYTIVNGDIQYIDLIEELVPSLDLLGSNVYRGRSFTDIWARVDEKLDLPLVFFEFGSDAFDARAGREDEYAQAAILKDQWREMYQKAYGNGDEGNAIGGFVFQWRDEWWKYLQTENLDIHDTHASWSNEGYRFDWAEGENNMNEEWFGITALGQANPDGVSAARPRVAYNVLAEVFRLDPYAADREAIDRWFADVDRQWLEVEDRAE